MRLQLLGGLSAARFLRDYWQKRPLLVRQAIPGFGGILSRHALFRLACREDARGRVVSDRGGRWHMDVGPFTRADFSRRPDSHWTLLVQDVNHHLDAAWTLLRKFDFIPDARLDDLMVSYAAPNGGVGPHVDSYDVFLLQGEGTRRWRISAQRDRECVPDVALKILRNFRPRAQWVLEPGDMLYLPPGYAHCGTAVTACMTYSIGFRAPTVQELGVGFLRHLEDELRLTGMYGDAGRKAARHPAQLDESMIEATQRLVDKMKRERNTIVVFLGCYLTEPKPNTFFTRPQRAATEARFRDALARAGVALDRRSRMLVRGARVYVNGEAFALHRSARARVLQLARDRLLPPRAYGGALADLLYQWYCFGFAHLPSPRKA
jgi:50S ribosomal protein L16 3-hydroxylase